MKIEEHEPEMLIPFWVRRAGQIGGRSAESFGDLLKMGAIAHAPLVSLGQPKLVLGVGRQRPFGTAKK